MKKLTEEFNAITVKKGEVFKVELTGGGFVGAHWDTKVVSGKVKLLSIFQKSDSTLGCAPVAQHWEYQAQEAGEIEILAEERVLKTKRTFKVRVS